MELSRLLRFRSAEMTPCSLPFHFAFPVLFCFVLVALSFCPSKSLFFKLRGRLICFLFSRADNNHLFLESFFFFISRRIENDTQVLIYLFFIIHLKKKKYLPQSDVTPLFLPQRTSPQSHQLQSPFSEVACLTLTNAHAVHLYSSQNRCPHPSVDDLTRQRAVPPTSHIYISKSLTRAI